MPALPNIDDSAMPHHNDRARRLDRKRHERSPPAEIAQRNRVRRHREVLVISMVVLMLAFALVEVPDGRVAVRGLTGSAAAELLPRALLGINCPGCGLTRSFIHLAEGDWRASWRSHRLGGLMAAVMIFQIPYRLLALRRPGRPLIPARWQAVLGYALIALLIANWLVDVGRSAGVVIVAAPSPPRAGRGARGARRGAAVAARTMRMPGSTTATEINPLREALPRTQVPEPCAIVLFGATGDLAHRKLVPALFRLAQGGHLPSECAIVGFARRDWTDEDLRNEYKKTLAKEGGPDFEELWAQFASRMFFAPGTFDDPLAFHKLKQTLEELDRTHGTRGNRVYYLAVSPEFFAHDHRAPGRRRPDLPLAAGDPWSRVVIEKPFGHDLESARR